MLQISVDSGAGALKLMLRFISEHSSQKTNEITLVAESQVTDDRFPILERVFGPVTEEIEDLKTNGIVDNGSHYNIVTFLVGDFKILYNVTGVLGPRCEHPCPWCDCPRCLMDCAPDDMLLLQFNSARGKVADLQNMSENTDGQRAGTYNIFVLVTSSFLYLSRAHYWGWPILLHRLSKSVLLLLTRSSRRWMQLLRALRRSVDGIGLWKMTLVPLLSICQCVRTLSMESERTTIPERCPVSPATISWRDCQRFLSSFSKQSPMAGPALWKFAIHIALRSGFAAFGVGVQRGFPIRKCGG